MHWFQFNQIPPINITNSKFKISVDQQKKKTLFCLFVSVQNETMLQHERNSAMHLRMFSDVTARIP